MAKTQTYIFIGAYGSGKTEVAINFARRERAAGQDVSLIDLDLVNPYYRSRDAREELALLGLRVISSAAGLEGADLPALSPSIIGTMQQTEGIMVFDVGGDPVGARALARFHELLTPRRPEVWLVVNPYRPETGRPDQIGSLAGRLTAASRQELTGLVNNANLGPETTLPVIQQGFLLNQEFAELLGLPLIFTAVPASLAASAEQSGLGPILPLHRQMLLPWED